VVTGTTGAAVGDYLLVWVAAGCSGGVAPSGRLPRGAARPPCAAGTRDYAACLAVLTISEWLYLDWTSRAPDPLPAGPIAREWIKLHDNLPFAAWVAFLRRTGPPDPGPYAVGS
jgi:hypothetical protein